MCRITIEIVELKHKRSQEHFRIWEQHVENNNTKKQEEGKQKRIKMQRSKVTTKKISPDGLTIASTCRLPRGVSPRSSV